MTQHTPGPWVLDGPAQFANQETGHMVYAQGGNGRNGHLVAELRNEYAPDNQSANARLIAAAPDLLKACKLLLTCSLPHDVSGRAMVDRARAAVRKAEGAV